MDAFLNNVGGIAQASVICMYDLPRHMVMTSLGMIAILTILIALPLAVWFAYRMDRRYVRRRTERST